MKEKIPIVEPLVIVNLEHAPTQALIEELYNRFNSVVIVYEEDGKDIGYARNGLRYYGMEAAVLGLLEYAQRKVSLRLDYQITEQENSNNGPLNGPTN